MISLYQVKDGLHYQKIMKKNVIFLVGLSLLIISLITLITILNQSIAIYVIDVMLTSGLLSYIYYYLAFRRPYYKDAYIFLAKIQHYPLEIIKGKIINYSQATFVKWHQHFFKVTLDSGRILYIEVKKINEFTIGCSYTFQLLENCVIGYQNE